MPTSMPTNAFNTWLSRMGAASETTKAKLAPKNKMESKEPLKGLVQWSTSDNRRFIGTSHTVAALVPGLYDIQLNPEVGIYFQAVSLKVENLIKFPDTASDKVITEISNFWDRADIFNGYNLVHKRGILLYGPPGAGKSCLIQLILQDVIARDGIAIRFSGPEVFLMGMRVLREIQPETPVVVLMEDIDAILEDLPESLVLNILDGVESVQHTVFLASTNYPEKLGPRVINRPSRFDKRIAIGYPSAVARKVYFSHLLKEVDAKKLDLDTWVKDTDGFSFAHMRELFVACIILGDPYQEALENLKEMNKKVSSARDYSNRKSGFSPSCSEEEYEE